MKRKNISIYMAALLAMAAATSCSEADKEVMFDTSFSSICFSTDSISDKLLSYKDSVVTFSFALQHPSMTEYEVQVPVMVTGMPTNHDRKFQISVDEGRSSAQQGVHFDALNNEYTMPAGKVFVNVPIKVRRTIDMQNGYKEIRLRTEQSGEFTDLMIEEKSVLLIRITDLLTQPDWWEKWNNWFGKYSRAKYQQWLIIYGQEPLDPDGPGSGYAWSAPEIAYYLGIMREYFEDNPTLDEDGELIVVPNLQQ